MRSVERSRREDSILRVLLFGVSGRAFILGLLFSVGGLAGLVRALFVDGEQSSGVIAGGALITGLLMEAFVISEFRRRRRSSG